MIAERIQRRVPMRRGLLRGRARILLHHRHDALLSFLSFAIVRVSVKARVRRERTDPL